MASSNILPRAGFWKRAHYLNRMTMRDLVVAYFQHATILIYLALIVGLVAVAVAYPATPGQVALCIISAALLYPLSWYGIHRFILHGGWMHKHPVTAKSWKRTHYDHHQDPYHLEVLFGALEHTLPAVAVTTALAGWAIGGLGGAAAAFAAGLTTTCLYEFFHCIQHLGFTPKNAWVAEIKRRHMEHHFHDENGNYGITSFLPDKLFGTFYDRRERPLKSKTVFNLGYTEDVASRWPWVKRLSGGIVSSGPRKPDAREG